VDGHEGAAVKNGTLPWAFRGKKGVFGANPFKRKGNSRGRREPIVQTRGDSGSRGAECTKQKSGGRPRKGKEKAGGNEKVHVI